MRLLLLAAAGGRLAHQPVSTTTVAVAADAARVVAYAINLRSARRRI
jgi:hypothetical protein